MSDNKDYSKLTIEELLMEEKKIKKKETISAFIIGFLIGLMIYGVAKNGFGFLYIFLPLLLIGGVYKSSRKLKDNLKQIRTEIRDRRKIR